MIDILIVDDNDADLIKSILEQDWSILKNKARIKQCHCAIRVPENLEKVYKEDEVAINYIKGAKNIDLAFLDIGFHNEVHGENHYLPIFSMIDEIKQQHPYCQIIVMTDEVTSPFFKREYRIADVADIIVPNISKRQDNVAPDEYNMAFSFLLERRLFNLINYCNKNTKSLILDWLNGHNNLNEFEIDGRQFTVESLFIKHVRETTIQKEVAYREVLELIIDRPTFLDKEWLKQKGTDKNLIRRYGLKDYYFNYYSYYYKKTDYKIETLVSLAKGSICKLLDEIIKQNEIRLNEKEFTENVQKFRLKTELKLEKIKSKIPGQDMLKFIDFLQKRLLFLGYYFGCYFGVSGIIKKMQSRIALNDKDRVKWFNTYIYIKVKDQLSTENDELLGIDSKSDKEIEKKARDRSKFGETNLKKLSPPERDYERIYQNLADYEKVFINEIIDHVKKLGPKSDHKENIEYIDKMVLSRK